MGMSMEEQLAYVMIVLKHCELPQPKYKAIAEEAGINNSNNAQKKFKAIVEGAGYKLVERQIVDKDGSASKKPTAAPAAAAPKKVPAKKSGAAAVKVNGKRAKKRKVEEVIDVDEEGADADGDVKFEGDADDVEMTAVRGRSVTLKADPGLREASEEYKDED